MRLLHGSLLEGHEAEWCYPCVIINTFFLKGTQLRQYISALNYSKHKGLPPLPCIAPWHGGCILRLTSLPTVPSYGKLSLLATTKIILTLLPPMVSAWSTKNTNNNKPLMLSYHTRQMSTLSIATLSFKMPSHWLQLPSYWRPQPVPLPHSDSELGLGRLSLAVWPFLLQIWSLPSPGRGRETPRVIVCPSIRS